MADLKSMFAKMSGDGGGDAEPAATKKKPTIERVYQKKTPLEHILLRPDTYIGSVEHVTEDMWVFDEASGSMVLKKIDYVPGLFKIFDEILVNAADNKQRDKKMDCIKIDINQETNTISVWNNGMGIPVVMHKEENMYVPSMIFGHLLTSSNYNDAEEKVTGGRNGYGAKLSNIFSTKFTVETASKEYKRQFKQTWGSNMTKTSEPKIKEFFGDDFTKITFSPDLAKFKMDRLDDGIVAMMSRRAYDIAASTKGVKVFLNGKRLPVKSFKDYVELYTKNKEDDVGNPLKVIYELCNERWEVAMTITSDTGFQQMSFVNSIATTKGGRHVDYVADMIVKQVLEVLKKKNKGGTKITSFQIKSHMWLFINCLIVNPSFDSQTKENLTTQVKNFGSRCTLSDKFIAQVTKSGVIELVLSWAKSKEERELMKKGAGKKKGKLKGVAKLEDANEAGSRNGINCTLILTEGDSAKTLAVSGLGVIGRDYYGVFPLRGKLLNVREATHKQILENAEINNLVKILGLQYKKKYRTQEDMATLRYGKVMIMTDQDQDGSHIKGLLINFIHYNWPELLQRDFLEEFITPIVKATKRNEILSFYSLPEFEEWKSNTPNHNTYSIKYYKGLGTSTSAEAKEYFRDMARHRIKFVYQGQQDDDHIVLAFSKKHVEQRKEWLTNFMVESKRRKELGLPERYLYTKNTKTITYTDFINLELVLFSNADNVRSIPCLIDGLKPGQRKVLFTCIKRNDKKEVKVAQLAGSVAEHSAYHHGEQSLCATIVNLAQNFVGSNNINLLEPRGQFGTRLTGGKDSASARYIFTKMSPLTRMIFHPHDDPLLKHEYDDNLKIEPVWYVPIIPMVLVNGAEGIGTGWMTKIPNYNPREIVANIRKMLDDEEPKRMLPWYKNFLGTIDDGGDQRYVISGEIAVIGNDLLEITELPVGTWTQNYKENVLEPLLHGSEKIKPQIADYKEYNTDTTVKFVIKCLPGRLTEIEKDGFHKFFKLQTVITTGSMCAFDELGCLRCFTSVMDILEEFFTLRLRTYQRRKEFLEGMLEAEAAKLSNQARFIMEKCSGELVVENKKRKTIVEELLRRGYAPDPVKEWKKATADEGDDGQADDDDEEEQREEQAEKKSKAAAGGDPEKAFKKLTDVKKFDYLLGLSMWMLTDERKNELLRQKDAKLHELEVLRKKTKQELWREDLDAFMDKLDAVEEKERKEAESVKPEKKGSALGKKKVALAQTLPSPQARRIEPTISEDIKKKIQMAVKTKENRVKRAVKKEIVDDEDDEFDAMVNSKKSLKDKLGTPEEAEKRGKAKKKDGLKQTKLNFKKKSPDQANGTLKKKGKKRFSDSDGSAESGSDVEFKTEATVLPTTERVERSRRAAAAKAKKYDFSDEEAQSSDGEEELFENKDVFDDDANKPKIVDMSSESETEKKPAKRLESSEDLFDSLLASDKKETSPSPVKTTETAAPKRKRQAFDSDSDSDDMFMPKKSTKTNDGDGGAKQKPTKTKPKKVISDDDSEGETKTKKKLTKKKTSDDEDFVVGKKAGTGSDSDADMFLSKKPPAKSRAKKVIDSDGETKAKKKRTKKKNSDDEDFAISKKTKGAKKQKSSVSDEDDDDGGDDYCPPVQRTARAGRATKKPTNYVFDLDDESD